MNENLKQRLVGALILVALGVVFWPIIFVQPEDKVVEQQTPIPPWPEVTTESIDPPDPASLRTSPEPSAQNDGTAVDAESVDDVSAESIPSVRSEQEHGLEPKPEPEPESEAVVQSAADEGQDPLRSAAPEPLAMDSDGVPVAWILQVATVSSPDKAEKLRKTLLDMNHKAYVTLVNVGGKSLFRVCIGPKFERDKLGQLKADIDAQFGVTSMIARYVP